MARFRSSETPGANQYPCGGPGTGYYMGTVASANAVVVFIQPLEQNIMIIVFFVFTAAIVMADRMWKRLPEAHPAVQGA